MLFIMLLRPLEGRRGTEEFPVGEPGVIRMKYDEAVPWCRDAWKSTYHHKVSDELENIPESANWNETTSKSDILAEYIVRNRSVFRNSPGWSSFLNGSRTPKSSLSYEVTCADPPSPGNEEEEDLEHPLNPQPLYDMRPNIVDEYELERRGDDFFQDFAPGEFSFSTASSSRITTDDDAPVSVLGTAPLPDNEEVEMDSEEQEDIQEEEEEATEDDFEEEDAQPDPNYAEGQTGEGAEGQATEGDEGEAETETYEVMGEDEADQEYRYLEEDDDSMDDDDLPPQPKKGKSQYHTLHPPAPLREDAFTELPPDISLHLQADLAVAKTYMEQVSILVDSLRPAMSWAKIGKMFVPEKNSGTIMDMYRRSKAETMPVGRPPKLTPEEISQLADEVAVRFYAQNPMTFLEMQCYVFEKFQKYVKRRSLYSIIRRSGFFKVAKAKVIEANRATVSPEQIQDFYNFIRQSGIEEVPPWAISNLDEVGCQKFVDARDSHIIVPAGVDGKEFELPVERNEKRSTLLACITLDGTYMKPLVIVDTANLTVDLTQAGFTKMVASVQPSGFITTELFDKWTRDVYFKRVVKMRRKKHYECMFYLFLDGCSCHYSDDFLDDCSWYGVQPIFLPPHSSHLLQPLDLLIFALMKREQDETVISGMHPKSKQIAKMLTGYQKACTPANITAAFKRAGILKDVDAAQNVTVRVAPNEAKKAMQWCQARAPTPTFSLK